MYYPLTGSAVFFPSGEILSMQWVTWKFNILFNKKRMMFFFPHKSYNLSRSNTWGFALSWQWKAEWSVGCGQMPASLWELLAAESIQQEHCGDISILYGAGSRESADLSPLPSGSSESGSSNPNLSVPWDCHQGCYFFVPSIINNNTCSFQHGESATAYHEERTKRQQNLLIPKWCCGVWIPTQDFIYSPKVLLGKTKSKTERLAGSLHAKMPSAFWQWSSLSKRLTRAAWSPRGTALICCSSHSRGLCQDQKSGALLHTSDALCGQAQVKCLRQAS